MNNFAKVVFYTILFIIISKEVISQNMNKKDIPEGRTDVKERVTSIKKESDNPYSVIIKKPTKIFQDTNLKSEALGECKNLNTIITIEKEAFITLLNQKKEYWIYITCENIKGWIFEQDKKDVITGMKENFLSPKYQVCKKFEEEIGGSYEGETLIFGCSYYEKEITLRSHEHRKIEENFSDYKNIEAGKWKLKNSKITIQVTKKDNGIYFEILEDKKKKYKSLKISGKFYKKREHSN